MAGDRERAIVGLGMKVSVRRSGQNRIGVVTRLAGDYVVVRRTNWDLGETAEYQAHRDDGSERMPAAAPLFGYEWTFPRL